MQESFPTERSVNLTNGDVYNFDYSYSPVKNITYHDNFINETYDMIVICGFISCTFYNVYRKEKSLYWCTWQLQRTKSSLVIADNLARGTTDRPTFTML